MVILDTNILIDHIRRHKGIDSHLVNFIEREGDKNLTITLINIQELYTGLSSKTSYEQRLFIALIGSLKILPYTYEVAQLAGEILRDIRPNMGFADAAIAATAILNKAKLLTLNKKDFKRIKGLKLI